MEGRAGVILLVAKLYWFVQFPELGFHVALVHDCVQCIVVNTHHLFDRLLFFTAVATKNKFCSYHNNECIHSIFLRGRTMVPAYGPWNHA